MSMRRGNSTVPEKSQSSRDLPSKASSSIKQQQQQTSSTTRASGAKKDSEEQHALPALGAGWCPISLSQQYRLLNNGPLYDPKIAPIIPPPFLIDEEEQQQQVPSSSSPDLAATVPSADTGLHLPRYRIASPLTPALSHDTDEDEVLCAPMPADYCFPLTSVLQSHAQQQQQQQATSSATVMVPKNIVDIVSEDEELRDVAFAHETVIAMFRLGKPHGWDEATFETALHDVRDVLARQRRLFPADTEAATSSKVGTTKNALNKKNASASTTNEDDAAEDKGRIKVNQPRVVEICFDDPILYEACALVNKQHTTAVPSPAIPSPNASTTKEEDSEEDGDHNTSCHRATWKYDSTFASTINKVLKKTELFRKKQQLFVGLGRSVVFKEVQPVTEHSAPVFEVDVIKRGTTGGSMSAAKDTSSSRSMNRSSRSEVASVAAREAVTTPPLVPSVTTAAVESTVSFGPMVQEQESDSGLEDQKSSEDAVGSADSPGQNSEDPLAARQGDDEANTIDNTFKATPSIYAAVSESSTFDPSHRTIHVKNCGDPKAMSLLDKCEWDKDTLTDDFDLVHGNHRPSQVVVRNFLQFVEDGRRAASSGRVDLPVSSSLANIAEVATFRDAALPTDNTKKQTIQDIRGGVRGVPPTVVGRSNAITAKSVSATTELASTLDRTTVAVATKATPSDAGGLMQSSVSTGLTVSSDSKPITATRDTELQAPKAATLIEEPQQQSALLPDAQTKRSTQPDEEMKTKGTKESTIPSSTQDGAKDTSLGKSTSTTTDITRRGKQGDPVVKELPSSSSNAAKQSSDGGSKGYLHSALSSILGGGGGSDHDALPAGLPDLTVVFSAFEVHSALADLDEDDTAFLQQVQNQTLKPRTAVSFCQPRAFYLRPPRNPEDNDDEDVDEDEDEFWDDAVEELQGDMEDDNVVPSTPPSTPLRWKPPPLTSEKFVAPPFTQMLIERLEAGLEDRRQESSSSSEEDSDEDDKAAEEQRVTSEGGIPPGDGRRASQSSPSQAAISRRSSSVNPATDGDAAAQPTKRRKSRAADADGIPECALPTEESIQKMLIAARDAAERMEQERERRRQLFLASGDQHASLLGNEEAFQRNMERFMAKSRSNQPKRGEARLLNTLPPMRMEGTVSVVRRLMKRARKDVLSLAKKAKEAQLVSFRPSRRFLAEVLRLRSFGPLMVALLSNPDDPIPEDVIAVRLDELGERLESVWENAAPPSSTSSPDVSLRSSDTSTGREWWTVLRQELSQIHRDVVAERTSRSRHMKTPTQVPWSKVLSITSRSSLSEDSGSAPPTRSGPRSSNTLTINTVDETVLRKSGPFFPHFLPRPSTHHSSLSHGEAPTLPTLRGHTPIAVNGLQAQAMANIRRVPRTTDQRGGLDATYSSLDDKGNAAKVFPRAVGGGEAGKRAFSASKLMLLRSVPRPSTSSALSTTTGGSSRSDRLPTPTLLNSSSSVIPPAISKVVKHSVSIVLPLVETLPKQQRAKTPSGCNERAAAITHFQTSELRVLHEELFLAMHPTVSMPPKGDGLPL